MGGTKKGFTLVEILIAIAILGVLSAATFIAINPSERFKQSRDTERVADISNLNTLITQKRYSHVRRDLGNAQVVYISLPDTSATCSSYTLPTLPSGWSYACVTQEDVLNVDGTGWLPVDISESRAMSALPLDPLNTQDYFYAYTIDSDEAFILTTALESEEKLKGTALTDGGNDDVRFEKGTNLALWDKVSGLVAYWPLNEGTNIIVVDKTTNTNNGTLVNNPTWESGEDCFRENCISFDGINDHIIVSNSASLNPSSEITFSVWIKPTDITTSRYYSIMRQDSGANRKLLAFQEYGTVLALGLNIGGTYGETDSLIDPDDFTDGQWHHIVYTYNGNFVNLYVDGSLKNGPVPRTGVIASETAQFVIASNKTTSEFFKGSIDDIRVYERALTQSEIESMYKMKVD